MVSDEELIKLINKKSLPRHVGLILDGNRRWAKKKGLNPLQGHSEGYKVIKEILRFAVKAGIKYVSAYVLSIENFKRSKAEVKHLASLLGKGLKELANDQELKANKVRIKVIGRLNLLPLKLQEDIKNIHELTKNYNKFLINLCIAYDGQDELVDAVKSIINSGLKASKIDRKTIKTHLYTNDSPELDLIIRTGMEGAARISGFLLWDASYAEFKFRDEFWPDYTKEMFVSDLNEFALRQRRFGK